SRYDIHIVSVSEPQAPPRDIVLGTGLYETTVAKSAEQAAFEAQEAAMAGTTVSDIVASRAVELTSAFQPALEAALDGADGVLLAHPYLLPAAQRVGRGLPVIYDAHNFELSLKGGVLDATNAQRFLEETTRIEGDAVRQAALISACSDEDAAGMSSTYNVDASRF